MALPATLEESCGCVKHTLSSKGEQEQQLERKMENDKGS